MTGIRREAWDPPGMAAGVETAMPDLTPDFNLQLRFEGKPLPKRTLLSASPTSGKNQLRR